MNDPRDGGGYLKVTFRRIQGEDRPSGRVLGVFCPRREQAVDLSECRTCEHCRGLCIDPRDRESFLRCTWENARPDAIAREPREKPDDRVSEPPARSTSLSAIMTAPAHCVTPETTVGELTELFLRAGISAAPVVDPTGKAIGIISKSDVLQLYTDDDVGDLSAPDPNHTLEGGVALALGIPAAHAGRISAMPVRDIMTRLVFALGADASLSRAAALMAYEGVHRIVVAGADGSALGIVSSLDILRWIARRDGYVLPDHTRIQTDRNLE
jgi:CBS domain-containing protein